MFFPLRWNKRATDEALLASFVRGRCRAFEELVARYGAPIEIYARRLLQNPQLAEEVVADTFERLAREAGALKLQGSLRSYLFTIAHHRCMDLLRTYRREAQACASIVDLELERARIAPPETAAWLGELAGALEEALARLPEAHREVVLLRLVHGLSGEETASILGCTEGQVRSQLSYARKLLRKHLAEGEGAPVLEFNGAGKELGTI